MPITVIQIENFLREVDSYFPVPLSCKQDLHDFSLKLHQKATLCYELDGGDDKKNGYRFVPGNGLYLSTETFEIVSKFQKVPEIFWKFFRKII